MNKFNVETPQEWKSRLYAKTSGEEGTKAFRFKPAMAAISVILIFALTTSAFAFTAIPDFFRSIFQGNNEYLEPLFVQKNIAFDSDTEDIEVLCDGIMGDKNNIAVSFTVKAKGDTAFDINNIYAFETVEFRFDSKSPSNSDGYSSTFGLNYSDSKTLVGDLYISGSSGNGFSDNKLKITLKNLECLKPYDAAGFERILSCSLTSEISVDYTDTSKELSAIKSEIAYKDMIFSPVCSEISNISLNAEFKMIKGNAKDLGEAYPFETITVAFKDGTVSTFNFKEKTQNQNIFYVKSVTQTEESYIFSGVFGDAVDASEVFSVKFNGTELFTDK